MLCQVHVCGGAHAAATTELGVMLGLPLILQKNPRVPSGNHGDLQCRFSFPGCTPEGQGGPGRLGSAQGHHGD